MKQVHIAVVDKVVTVLDTDVCIDCSSGEEYQLIFTLDAEWSGYTEKTAKLTCGGYFYSEVLVDNACEAPTIKHSGYYCLHLCAGNLHTTTPAMINCVGVGETPEPGQETVIVDTTLTQSGQAADAKVTGDKIVDLENDVKELGGQKTATKLPDNGIVDVDVMYFLGEVSEVSVGFPATAPLGSLTYVSFTTGDAAPRFEVTTDNVVGLVGFTPLAGKFYELIGLWNGHVWTFVKNEVAV